MDRISAFISYSSVQKVICGKLKSCLTNFCGFDIFIAHEDIPGSVIWEEEILKRIEHSDFFIPLISESFKKSDFTDQETGIAFQLKKVIIPIKLERVNPYGFINKYQALQYKSIQSYAPPKDNLKEIALTIAQIGLRSELSSLAHQKSLNSIVYAFCNCRSFEAANATIQILSNYDHFTPEHLDMIIKSIDTNPRLKVLLAYLCLKVSYVKHTQLVLTNNLQICTI